MIMEKNTAITDLKETIRALENKKVSEWAALKEEFLITAENLKPINILKKTLKKAVSAPELKDNIINTAIGLTTGFVAKKTLIGKTHNPFKKLLGLFLEMTVANNIANNADTIKSLGGIVLKKIIHSGNNSAVK
jgi:hypothetical protein